ncbi:MAG TPA: GNAT family N-acetyltransferase [Sporomusaceae bacterium]|uniref:bifunctional helix-turn-helix transcriptional regulator/GNAT family N-acetyltransferase n=1 Tax=Anaerospora sp. TaxID=1960278 RepID=UPI000EC7FBCC|nr:helix-turn-helix domain-containing GNAT family N-acetyltransferase [Anaerospora sp.]HAK73081.1 GNAT family N-acetyltransferase [Sporomusaceae bacterium]
MNDRTQAQVNEIRKFNRFYTNIIGLVNQTILESPYSLAEARVLVEMDNAAACTASDLTELLQIDPGYLSRILRRFKKEGLIETNKSLTDRRSQNLVITDKGREIYRRLAESSSLQLIHLLEQIPQGGQKQLVDHMTAIQALLSGNNTTITIREYKPGDCGYIAYRHGVLYAQEHGFDQIFEKYVLQSLLAYLENPAGGKILIAEYCGTIVGFIGIVQISKTSAQLRWFLIEPEFRGAGAGRKLMAAAMEYCHQQKYNNVFLWTFKGLDAACHLYEQYGFTLTEEKENNTWKKQLLEQRWDVTLSD